MIAASDMAQLRVLYAQTRQLAIVSWFLGAGLVTVGVALGVGGVAGGWRIAWAGAFVIACNVAIARPGVLSPRILRRQSLLRWIGVAQIVAGTLSLGWAAVATGGAQSPAILLFVPVLYFAGCVCSTVPQIVLTLVGALLIGGVAIGWNSPVTALNAAWAAVFAVGLLAIAWVAWRTRSALIERESARIEQTRQIGALATALGTREAMLAHDERLVAMGRMAAGIAHEIANPLASMDSVLQLMQRQKDQPRPEAIESLRTQVRRILQIARQLTNQAHPGRGTADVVSLDEVVQSSLDMLVFSKRSESVRAQFGLHNGLGTVCLNASAMQQVVTNLLVNALDATEGVAEPRVDVRTFRDGPWCVIEVTDNGLGIKPQHRARIFEPFYTTKPVGRGTGLGLSICARLVQEQRGRIELSCESASGATFQVRVPSAAPGESNHMIETADSDPRTRSAGAEMGCDCTGAGPTGAARRGIGASQ